MSLLDHIPARRQREEPLIRGNDTDGSAVRRLVSAATHRFTPHSATTSTATTPIVVSTQVEVSEPPKDAPITWQPYRVNTVDVKLLGPGWERVDRPDGGYYITNRASKTGVWHMVRAGWDGHPVQLEKLMNLLSKLGDGVIGVPTPGFYDLRPIEAIPTLIGFARDHVALIDELRAEDPNRIFSFNAHSMGGFVTALVVALRPEVCQLFTSWNAIGAEVKRTFTSTAVRQAWNVMHEPTWMDVLAVAGEFANNVGSPQYAYLNAVGRQCNKTFATSAYRTIAANNVPVVVLHGRRDPVVRLHMSAESARAMNAVAHVELDDVHAMMRLLSGKTPQVVEMLHELLVADLAWLDAYATSVGITRSEALVATRQQRREAFWEPAGARLMAAFSELEWQRPQETEVAQRQPVAEAAAFGLSPA